MDDPRARQVARVLGFALLFVLSVVVGRGTRPEGAEVALAWPAAGVGVWWLLSSRGRGETALAAGLVTSLSATANLLTGAPPVAALLFSLSNGAHAVVGLLVLRRLLPGTAPLRSPGDVARVLLASVVCSAASAGVAALTAGALLRGDGAWETLLLVLVRNGGTTFVLLSAVLAVRGTPLRGLRTARPVELATAWLAAVALFAVVFAVDHGMPLLFLCVLVPVWFGTRLGVGATALAGAVLSAVTVVLTLVDHGPVAEVGDVQARAVVVQGLVVVLTLVGLSLATQQRAWDDVRARLEDSRRELQRATDAAVIGKAVVVRGADGGWTLTRPNPALVRLLGRDPSAMRWRELLFPQDSLAVRAALDRIADGLDEAWEGEVRHCLPGGGSLWTQLHVSRLPSETGTSAVVAQLLDITERRAAQQELSRLALHDSLTGLPNRARLRGRLEEMLVDAGSGARVVVVFVDLDGFKAVNDGFGHEVGDGVLQAVGAALLSALRPEDVVARFGGDEFVACCPGLSSPAEAEALVRRVVATVSPALRVRGRDVGLGVSAGWTLSGPGDDAPSLLRRSDEAMYAAKRSGGHGVHADPSVHDGWPTVPAPR
ncbi:diguanylate cyclase domain-containing protein [Aquipuribacter hungaricus]|uniref:Diguanylate cyclase domain-containing protein n=1 Tax=Aquipuribacter hungaricus TaxID=545624 RepID=A0ABV7WJB4_9MICO